jgi:predicted hydrocarbon binding protein
VAIAEGTSFRGKLGIAVKKTLTGFDAAAVRRATERLSPAARALLTERFVASAWYPVAGIEEVIEVLADELGCDAEELAKKLGRGVGVSGAGPVGRTMISLFGNPRRFEKYLPTMWRQLYDSGTMHARFDPVDGVLSARVYGWKGHSPLHCYAPLGAIEELASHLNQPSLKAARRSECVVTGAKRCSYELAFELE